MIESKPDNLLSKQICQFSDCSEDTRLYLEICVSSSHHSVIRSFSEIGTFRLPSYFNASQNLQFIQDLQFKHLYHIASV